MQLVTHSLLSHLQLLQGGRCLLVTGNTEGDCMIFCEHTHNLSAAVEKGHTKKHIRSERIGHQILLAYDETKHMLGVCSGEKVSLTCTGPHHGLKIVL